MKNNVERIKDLNMSITDAISIVTGGNPGSLTVLMMAAKSMDMMDFMFGVLLRLDAAGMHDHKIWEMYKDIHKENLDDFIKACKKL